MLVYADSIKSSDFSEFQRYLHDIKEQSNRLTAEQQVYLKYLTGYEQGFLGNFEQSIHILQSIPQATVDTELMLRAQSTLLNILTIQGRFAEAFVLADEITQQVPKSKNTTARLHALRVVALLYNHAGLYEEALHYSMLAQQQSSQGWDLCPAKQLMIESYYRLKKVEYVDEMYSRAVVSCQQAGDQVFESLVHYYYIRYLLDIEDFQRALQMTNEYYKNVQQLSYEPLHVYYQALKAEVYYLVSDFDSAEQAALEVISRMDTSQYFEAHVIANNILYQLYERQDDYKSALHYHKLLHQTQLQYRDAQSERIRSFHETKAVMQAKTQQIEFLNMENSLLNLQQQVLSKEAQNARLLLGLFVLLLLVLGFFAYQGLMGRHRFKFMAENDELTGISNRYHFNKLAEKSLLHCKKQGLTVGVILFDLDHFKQINDKFGHATGDWVLQQVVQSCRNFMRLDDVFGRLGGEEFAILLPGCHADKALMLAEICRDSIEDIDTKRSGHEFLLTASFGVTSSDTSGYELKQLLSDADQAMYRAKQGGRNQVHFFTGTPAAKLQPQPSLNP